MTFYNKDKLTEKERYDVTFKSFSNNFDEEHGSASIPLYYRAPYICYEEVISRYAKGKCKVLEIGSGSGRHTKFLLNKDIEVVASDISSASIELLKKKFFKVDIKYLKIKKIDMEEINLDINYFDIVCCAGSLSYGDTFKVKSEIYKTLKPGGYFICVDSLNDNFIYKFYRYLAYLANKRTISTIINMPTKKTIDSYDDYFYRKEIYFFGLAVWLVPFFKFILSDSSINSLLVKIDKIFKTKYYGYKYVAVFQKKNI